MKFGPVPLDEAVGAILAHSQKVGEHTIRKGSLLDEAAIARMRAAGRIDVICAQLEPGERAAIGHELALPLDHVEAHRGLSVLVSGELLGSRNRNS